ncbi:MAG TPA: metallophosphoesterase family protein [Thermoanaerobaculia bacterium]|mgnify:CR=1 FL=1|jgi:UDP-2,3-diacylglucosamine pyrophosphatase LpxH|nr:metallophosphoesterase family protein [Thermoanaerobaculia bacterium]HQN06113.1 metallophosphoesterase family protein [Thermoanaerobaculia bacterium]HQP88268.1 metallophosphoesterase family protein [Thermoanaerobaculia bacterium]
MSRSDQALTETQLNSLWEPKDGHSIDLDLEAGLKLAILSDLHLGDGTASDDFRDNEPALRAALRRYRDDGVRLVLLGDIEDFWKFDLDPVERRYRDTVYKDLRAFPTPALRIFGNHDIEWRQLRDPAAALPDPTRDGFPEGVRLIVDRVPRALLVHGHQGTLDSDRGAWFSRFFVHIWGSLEPFVHALGLHPTNPAATASDVLGDFERTLYSWGKTHGRVLICGHSHRAYFASRSRAEQLRDEQDRLSRSPAPARSSARKSSTLKQLEGLRAELEDERKKGRDIGPLDAGGAPGAWYYNTGCGLYSNGVTAIEIERPAGAASQPVIRLVFWDRQGSKTTWNTGPL